MEPEGSLLCSQDLTIGLYPELDESSPYPLFYLSEIQFSIILPSCGLL
jgi:hypothetical protein